MTNRSEDSHSSYSRQTLHRSGSLTTSAMTSPNSSEVILGGKSIAARRMSPQSTLFGTSGAWSLQQEASRSRGLERSQSRQMRDLNESSLIENVEVKSDADLIGEMFTSVNSGLQVKFPESPEVIPSEKQLPRIKFQQAKQSFQAYPNASHFGLCQDLNPAALTSSLLSTPPRKKKGGEPQSRFSTSPDTRSSLSSRHAKVIKNKASQGRLRKVSTAKREVQISPPSDSSIRARLKPQSSIQGLKKLVGLTPNTTRSKSTMTAKHEEFPDSLRLVIETHAIENTDKMTAALNAQRANANANVKSGYGRITPYLDHDHNSLPNVIEDEVLVSNFADDKDGLPRPSLSCGNIEGTGFWRKLRSSTRPRESNETIRATSRCESRATRRGNDDDVDGVLCNGTRRSKWWNRIRDNAVKMVGQRETASTTYNSSVGTLPRPSMAPYHGRRKASLDAATALADGLIDCESSEGPSQVEQELAMRLGSSKGKKRPPVPLLLLQDRQDNGLDDIYRNRPATSLAAINYGKEDSQGPLSAHWTSQVAKDRSGSKKNWLRPLQLTANLKNGSKVGSNQKVSITTTTITSTIQRKGKQSDSCLLQKSSLANKTSILGQSPQRTRLSVPALSSLKYKDTLPIPPRTRQSRASTISSIDSRISIKDESKSKDEVTQRTIGSSILYKDEEILGQQNRQYSQPPSVSLPHLPLPFSSSARTISPQASFNRDDNVTPREATDILYNLVSRFKNDGSPSTFRTTSAITQTIASSRLTPLHLSPEVARNIRGRRSVCTTLESILTYQSSTDYSESSFHSQTIGSLADDTKQDNHLQTLIDGVLEDIECLVSQSVTSSNKGSERNLRGAFEGVSNQHERNISDTSLGSAHSQFHWPPKCKTNQESGQLRLLGAKLFPSAIEIAPLDSPCPPSRKKSLPLLPTGCTPEFSIGGINQASINDQLDFHHFPKDYIIGQAHVPLLTSTFQEILKVDQHVSPKTATVTHHEDPNTSSNSFHLSSQSHSVMGQSIVSSIASSPPSILIQRPLSDTSISTCSMTTSQDAVIIGQAKVVCNRKSSASLMDLNNILQHKNSIRSRTSSYASSIQSKIRDAFEYDIPDSPATSSIFTLASQPWSERKSFQYWNCDDRRQSFGTEYTDISPESSASKGKHQQQLPLQKYTPFGIEEVKEEEEVLRHRSARENLEYQEAKEIIEKSLRQYPNSDYARQILSSKDYASIHPTKDGKGSDRIPSRVMGNFPPTERKDVTIINDDIYCRKTKRSKEKQEKIDTITTMASDEIRDGIDGFSRRNQQEEDGRGTRPGRGGTGKKN